MANKRIRNYDDGSASVASTDSIAVDRTGLDELERVTLAQAVTASGVVSTHAAVTSGVHGISAFAATVLDDANAAAARTTLGAETAGAAATAQAAAVQRANHTGSQLAATISDFSTAVAAAAAVTANTAKTSNATHSGDVTGATALTIANDAVTNAKAANMAASTIKGRVTASTGDPEDLTPAQARTVIASDSGGGTSNFLRADGTWAAPAGGGTVPPSYVTVGKPITGTGFMLTIGTSSTTILHNAYSVWPVMFTDGATLSSLKVNCWTGVASSEVKIGLFASDSTGVRPGALVATLATFDTATSGQKTATGLSQAVTANVVYWIGAISSTSTNGIVTGSGALTAGLSQAANGNYSFHPTGFASDNNTYFGMWTATPAVNGSFDASPSWSASNSLRLASIAGAWA